MTRKQSSRTRSSNGLGVDAAGSPVVDPTENVKALSEAAQQRQDDLREAHTKLVEANLLRLEQIATLRAEHATALAKLESDRLNAIRQVDVLAVNTAADRAAAAIQALAATTATNAETLRTALTTTATTIATQTANTVQGITERLAALEKSSYEGLGKSRVADPMVDQLLREVKALRESGAGSTGKSAGATAMWGYVAAGFGFLLTLAGIASLILGSR
jgi:hypothetical protein